jgi:spermidine/putrescine transport system substrate-binding protein
MTTSRRAFLAAAAGLALPGCRRATPRADDDPAAPLGPLERELAIYNWSDYVGSDTIAGFEREFGVRVTYDTYESNEELLAKLQTGASGYDLAVPSSYLLPALSGSGLLGPVHPRYLTNLGNIAPLFRHPPYDPAETWTVPWQWGVTGIAWRRDLVAQPPDGWEVFLDARWKNRMTMMDDGREVIGAMLKYRGRPLNDTDAASLSAAKADAERARANLRAYKSATVKGDLIAGDVWIAQLWNGDAAQAAREQPAIGFVVPRQGAAIWTDSFVMLREAPHPRAAHEFLNYVLRPEVAAAASDATGYGSPNAAGAALQRRPVPYPTAEERARLEYFADLGAAAMTWDRIWTEIKSA